MPNRTLWFTLLGIAGALACGGPSKDNFNDPTGASGEAATGGSSSGKGGTTTGGASGKGGTGGSGTGGTSGSSSTTGGTGGAGGSGGSTGGTNAMGGSGSETGGTGGSAGGSGTETGGGAGMRAMGGTGSETGGAGGRGGMMAGNGGSAGKPMDPNCEELTKSYAEALATARTCNADSGKDQCTHVVSSSPTCGCPVVVNPDNEEAIGELERISKAAAGCDIVCTDVLCVEPEGGACVAESNDGGLCQSK
jgi:hypothetical protein